MPPSQTSTTNGDRPKTQAERTALAERKMIDAAVDLLNHSGIQGTTLKAIGDRAGYSRGLATHHFGTKAALFRKLLREVSAAFVRELENRVGQLTGLEAFDAANDAHLQHILNRPDHLRAMYILWFGSMDPGSGFKPNLSGFMHRQRESMAHWIRGGQQAGEIRPEIDADRMAEQLYAALIGINHQWLVDPALDLPRAYRDLKRNTRQLLQLRSPNSHHPADHSGNNTRPGEHLLNNQD